MATVKEKYGFLPTSVWHLPKDKFWKKIIQDKGDINTKRSKNCKYLPALKYSEFNPSIAERVIKYWSEENDLVIDPFAGRTTRGIVTIYLKRNYEGYEVAPTTFNKLIEKLNEPKKDLFSNLGKAKIWNEDGCKMEKTLNEIADLIFTCPPYWILEKYESADNQLSDLLIYEDFLKKIEECAQNCYRVLKPNKYLVWVVADFRKEGFKRFSKDSIDIFEKVGFVHWDTVIEVLNSPFVWCQIGKCEKQKYTSKQHQYLLVFKKN